MGGEEESGIVARESAWSEMGQQEAAHNMLTSRLRLIKEASEGKINFFALTHDELLDELATAGYPPSAESSSSSRYDYLLNTSVASMTLDGMRGLVAEQDAALRSMNAAKASAALFAREQLKLRMATLDEKKQRFNQVLDANSTHKDVLDKTAAELQEEVAAKMLAVDVALASREAELLEQVARVEKTKKTQLMETTEDLQAMAANLTSCVEEVEQVLAKSDPYDFLEAAAAVEGSVEEMLREGNRGFAAPDPSFQLTLHSDRTIAHVRQITLAENGGRAFSEGVVRAGHSPLSSQEIVATTSPHGSPEPRRRETADAEGAEPNKAAEVREYAEEEMRAASQGAVNGGSANVVGSGGESLRGAGESACSSGSGSVGRRTALGAGSGGGGKTAAQVEKTQIHMISPGLSGRERSSIITVQCHLFFFVRLPVS